MVGPRPFLVNSVKGDWDQKCCQDIKVLKQVFTGIHFFVRKVSVGSDR